MDVTGSFMNPSCSLLRGSSSSTPAMFQAFTIKCTGDPLRAVLSSVKRPGNKERNPAHPTNHMLHPHFSAPRSVLESRRRPRRVPHITPDDDSSGLETTRSTDSGSDTDTKIDGFIFISGQRGRLRWQLINACLSLVFHCL